MNRSLHALAPCVAALLIFVAGCAHAVSLPSLAAGNAAVKHDTSSQDLLYVANEPGTMKIYSYPGLELQASITFDETDGLCTDSAGDVYVTVHNTGKIVELAHGSTKFKRVLKLPPGIFGPVGCAIDPTSGDLAVTTNFSGVLVYTHAAGTPMIYHDSDFDHYNYCAYDANGNLYVDGSYGSASSFRFKLATLPKRAKAMVTLGLHVRPNDPGGVAWDGKYVDVSDAYNPIIYQYVVAGSAAREAHLIHLGHRAYDVLQFTIYQSQLIAPNNPCGSFRKGPNAVLIYPYPGGGKPHEILRKGVYCPEAVVVSPAGSR